MIEINLLPPQHRTVESTPLPVFLGLIGGIVVIAGLLLAYIQVDAAATQKGEQVTRLRADKEVKTREVELVRKLQRELDESQVRVNTILGIAESKIYWSYRLDELSKTIPKTAWLESLRFERGRFELDFRSRGTAYQRFTEVRRLLRQRTNILNVFGPISFTNVQVTDPGPEFLERTVLRFVLFCQLKEEPAAAPKR